MRLMERVRNFLRSEQGAITVDWVVLTAGLLALGLAVVFVVQETMKTLACKMDSSIQTSDGITSSGTSRGNCDR
jgi:Flp pilus assembly pilin Flp